MYPSRTRCRGRSSSVQVLGQKRLHAAIEFFQLEAFEEGQVVMSQGDMQASHPANEPSPMRPHHTHEAVEEGQVVMSQGDMQALCFYMNHPTNEPPPM